MNRSAPATSARNLTALALLALLPLVGCGAGSTEDVTITETRTLAVPGSDHQAGRSAAARFGDEGAMQGAGDGAPQRSTDLHWHAPAGWIEVKASTFNLARFGVADDPAFECTVSMAGGGILNNLNRWRDQFGLAPIDQAAMNALPAIATLGTQGVIAELSGAFGDKQGYRLVGMLVELGSQGAFIKMLGPDATVLRERAAFDEICASLVFEGGHDHGQAPSDSAGSQGMPAGHPTVAPSTASVFDPRKLTWIVPISWRPGRGNVMRLATFIVSASGETECVLTPLSGDAGGVNANFDQWRAQFGLEPMTDAERQALPQMKVLGASTPLLFLEGKLQDMSGKEFANGAFIGIISRAADHSIFIKLVGPADEVKAARADFEAFCTSLSYEE